MASFPSVYRAQAVRINDGPVLDAFVPQVFGETSILINAFVGGPPTEPGLGWVVFQGGNPEFPVWMGIAIGGGGGVGADEVFVGADDPGTAYELWYDTDAVVAPVVPSEMSLPRAKYRRVANQSIPNNTPTPITWDTEDVDELLISGSIPGSTLTIGQTSAYVIVAEVDAATSLGSGVSKFSIRINNSALTPALISDANPGGFIYIGSMTQWLRDGYTVGVHVTQDSGAAVNVTATIEIVKLGG